MTIQYSRTHNNMKISLSLIHRKNIKIKAININNESHTAYVRHLQKYVYVKRQYLRSSDVLWTNAKAYIEEAFQATIIILMISALCPWNITHKRHITGSSVYTCPTSGLTSWECYGMRIYIIEYVKVTITYSFVSHWKETVQNMKVCEFESI